MAWKKVSEETPKINGFYNVLIDTDEGKINHSCWFEDGEWKYDNYMTSGDALYSQGWYASVIYWQPLPESLF